MLSTRGPDMIKLPDRKQLTVLRSNHLLQDSISYFGKSSIEMVSRNVSPFQLEKSKILESEVLKLFVMKSKRGEDMILSEYVD